MQTTRRRLLRMLAGAAASPFVPQPLRAFCASRATYFDPQFLANLKAGTPRIGYRFKLSVSRAPDCEVVRRIEPSDVTMGEYADRVYTDRPGVTLVMGAPPASTIRVRRAAQSENKG